MEGVAGMHCIQAEVDSLAQGALDFGGKREVELGLLERSAENRIESPASELQADIIQMGDAIHPDINVLHD